MKKASSGRSASAKRAETSAGQNPGLPVNKSTLLILKSLYSFTSEQPSFGVSEDTMRSRRNDSIADCW